MSDADRPPDDHPTRLVPAESEAAAVGDMGPPGPRNPVSVAARFLNAVTHEEGPRLSQLRRLVTPESRDSWSDFREPAERLRGCGMTSRAQPSVGDPDVVYVKFVTEPDMAMRAPADMVINVRAILTMVWRPSLAEWRAHAVGDYVRPEDVPHG